MLLRPDIDVDRVCMVRIEKCFSQASSTAVCTCLASLANNVPPSSTCGVGSSAKKLDLRARPSRLPTPVPPILSRKTQLLLPSSFTFKFWTHLHVHLASISKQPAFPKSILQLLIYNLKQQLLTQSYYSSWNCVRCCSVSTCQIAAVQLTLLPPPIRI